MFHVVFSIIYVHIFGGGLGLKTLREGGIELNALVYLKKMNKVNKSYIFSWNIYRTSKKPRRLLQPKETTG